jgi:FixJ family two-component response regulator
MASTHQLGGSEMSASRPVVYILDDDASVRRSFARLLGFGGLRTRSFATASDFLAAETETANACLVADIQTSGVTDARMRDRLGAGDAALPVIAVAAEDTPGARDRAQLLGVTLLFRKPVDGQALLDAVNWVLASGRDRPLSKTGSTA